jgi:hypothetical protein
MTYNVEVGQTYTDKHVRKGVTRQFKVTLVSEGIATVQNTGTNKTARIKLSRFKFKNYRLDNPVPVTPPLMQEAPTQH